MIALPVLTVLVLAMLRPSPWSTPPPAVAPLLLLPQVSIEQTRREIRKRPVYMMEEDDDEDLSSGFGIDALKKSGAFITLWWSLWSLYDLYLTPYSPAPELSILTVATGIAVRGDAQRAAASEACWIDSESQTAAEECQLALKQKAKTAWWPFQ